MDKHRTLHTLVSSLFTENQLKNWTIFEEKSGSILVKLRFTNGNVDNSGATAQSPVAYKRKSTKQVTRDRTRAARHKDALTGVSTRSMASAEPASPELPRSVETYSISETGPLEFSPVLDTSTVSMCSAVHDGSVSCDMPDIDLTNENSLDPNTDCNTVTDSDSETHSEADSFDDMPTVPLLPPLADPNGVSYNKYRCLQPNCSYGGTDKRYELRDGIIVLVPLDPPDPLVMKCAACPGPPLYVCRQCNSKGRHKGHNPWLRLTKLDID